MPHPTPLRTFHLSQCARGSDHSKPGWLQQAIHQHCSCLPACLSALCHAITELEQLQAEIAGLRAELQCLQDIRADLRNVASLSHSFTSMTESYDDIKRLLAPGANVEDIAVIKRLLAEMVLGSRCDHHNCD